MLSIFILGSFIACKQQLPPELASSYATLPDEVDYNFHIRPILSEHCFSCHGPDEANRKAALRLDDPKLAFQGLEASGSFALVAGKPHKSAVFHRIISEDPAQIMPPPAAKLPLSSYEKALLIKWIEQGANYKEHWAFIKPKEPSLPEIQEKGWGKNEIDHFVLKKLEQKQLVPSEQADKATLIRRLSFDLTGLPPQPEEVVAFVNDSKPDAYERLVDQLLASPAYGERMAAYWMELARYADSDGYLDDKHRAFSPWRDWVIKAFNENQSYKDFVTWQLAGDLMPKASKEQVLATAFNRLHKKNSEAGIVLEEYRTEYVADRTNTFGKAFLGLTMECARCHSHKYDPISQKDYYSLFAFFNSTADIGHAVYGPDITPGPSLLLTDEAVDSQLHFINSAIERQEAALENALMIADKELPKTSILLANIDQRLDENLQAYYPFDTLIWKETNSATSRNIQTQKNSARLYEPHLQKGKYGKALFNSDYSTAFLGKKEGWFERTRPFSIDFWVYPDTVYTEASVFLHCEDWRLGYKGYSLHLQDNRLKFIMAHAYPQNAIQVQTTKALPAKKWSHVCLTYDGSSKANGVQIYLDGKATELKVDFDHLYKGILFIPDIHTYGFNGFQLGKRDGVLPMAGGGIDELRIFNRELVALEALYLHDQEAVAQILEKPKDNSIITAYQESFSPALLRKKQTLQQQRDTLNALLNTIPEIMVMGDLPEPRPTFILDRGNYDSPGEEVQADVPERLLSLPEGAKRNRLGLAKWLFHPDHPLTARVFVNHIWQMHFGKGLVKTTEDFGNQGALPSHPELLDWLAVQFMKTDWDIKALHKLIVLSATYQQSSAISPELLEKDPENIYLARASRFRLSAEMIRDNALAMSGLLVRKTGGPSVYPYQPAGLWDEISNKKWRYPYLEEPGEGLYRRSLYTIWKRTAPPPAMLIFDANDRTICRVKRKTTTTPLQALVLLNDPQYLEAANVLASKIEMEVADEKAMLLDAFNYVFGRGPEKEELEIAQALFDKEYTHFKSHQKEALEYLSIGKGKKIQTREPGRTAALAVVVNALMNSDEGHTRN